MSLVEAQHAGLGNHAVALPGARRLDAAQGVQLLRVLAAGYEIANTDRLLRSYRDAGEWGETGPAYRLGALATVWPRLEHAGSIGGAARPAGQSPWGDPGEDSLWACASACGWPGRTGPPRSCPRGGCWAPRPCWSPGRRFAAGHGLAPAVQRSAELLLGAGSWPR